MGLLARAIRIFRMKASALLSRAEDPAESLDYAYEQLKDEQADVEEAITTLTAQRVRLEKRRDKLDEEVEHHNKQARAAMEQGREDLARAALTKKKTKMQTVEDLAAQIDTLTNQQDSLEQKHAELKTRISEFRTQKETLKARHESAEAVTTVQETLSGIGDNNVGTVVKDVEEETEKLEARAQAISEMEDAGVLDSPLTEDDIDAELTEVTTASEVDAELDSLRAELDGPERDGDVEAELEPETEPED